MFLSPSLLRVLPPVPARWSVPFFYPFRPTFLLLFLSLFLPQPFTNELSSHSFSPHDLHLSLPCTISVIFQSSLKIEVNSISRSHSFKVTSMCRMSSKFSFSHSKVPQFTKCHATVTLGSASSRKFICIKGNNK